MSENPRQVKFDYIKSNFFRTLRCDGVIGGLNPQFDLVVNFFSERQPVPKSITCEMKPDMTLGAELGREIREGIVREVEVSVSMNLQMARSLRDWLSDRIQESEEMRKKYDLFHGRGGETQQTH